MRTFDSAVERDAFTATLTCGAARQETLEGFDGVTGRLDFKDVVADGSYVYRGHLRMP